MAFADPNISRKHTRQVSVLSFVVLLVSLLPGFGLANTDVPGSQDSPLKLATSAQAVTDEDTATRMALFLSFDRVGALGVGPSNEQSVQRSWRKQRDMACAARMNPSSCHLYDSYRLHDLAVAAIFRAPKQAFREIARTDPKSVQIYEAIYQYAVIRDPGRRANVVGGLLAPAFVSLRNRLRDASDWDAVAVAEAGPRDAASSDQRFSQFLNAISVWNDNDIVVLPCAALVRRPGLLYTLHSQYGGAIDGHLIQTDCRDTLPPLPELATVEKTAFAAHSPCSGTIRFSLGREFDEMVTAIRIHQFKDFNRYPSSASLRFASEHKILWERATSEMARYYSRYFHVPPAQARTEATGVLVAVLNNAIDDSCGI